MKYSGLTNIKWVSAAVLREPNEEHKGALVLAMVDEVLPLFPKLKEKFYIIEWRGWSGMNRSTHADIKLVEDPSTFEETVERFPKAICLEVALGDFVDTDAFIPTGDVKGYLAIQIASWKEFKRHELFLQAAALLPKQAMIKFGHFPEGNDVERTVKRRILSLARDISPNVTILYTGIDSNEGLPRGPYEINQWINLARMGVLTSKNEGMNRFKMECLSADIPFLVSSDASSPIKKHVNPKTGIVYDPSAKGLAQAMMHVLENPEEFSPREYILRTTGMKNSNRKLEEALDMASMRDTGRPYLAKISFSGRNQSLFWGERALRLLESYERR